MKYSFKDIYNEKFYNDSKIVFVTGQYNLFNNIVVDKFKGFAGGSEYRFSDDSIAADFSDLFDGNLTVQNNVDFDYFMRTAYVPSVNGKWFATLDLDNAPKKHLDWLNNYVKRPSEYALLCVTSTKYKNYRLWLGSRYVNSTVDVNLIQLSFPDRKALVDVVNSMFASRNAKIELRAVELFITRMNKEYDNYDIVIDKIIESCYPPDYMDKQLDNLPQIDYEATLKAMRGIEAFDLDDFLEKLTIPLSSDSVSGRKQVYKIMHYLIDSYGVKSLVNMLKFNINDLIEFRININNGNIPVIVNYNVDEAKEAVGKESKIAGYSDFKFKKLAKLASRTSLQDWIYMKLILGNAGIMDKDEVYEKVLYSLVTRSVLTESRLNSDVGLEHFSEYDMNYIDSIVYMDTE